MESKDWLVIALIFIVLLLAILLILKQKKDIDGGTKKGLAIRNAPRSGKGNYVVGGYAYPGSLPFQGWDPDNFSEMTYINFGNVYIMSDLTIATGSKLKEGFSEELANKLIKNGTKILISVFVSPDGVDFGPPTPSTQDMWNQALGKTENLETIADNLIRTANTFKADGIDFDWEPVIEIPPNVTENFSALLRTLKNKQLSGGNSPLIGVAVNDSRANSKYIDFSGISPYTDFIEVMCYLTENFPQDEANFPGIDKSKIMLGLGLSSYSFTGVPPGTNPDCPGSTTINNDWFAVCPQNPGGYCDRNGVFPSWNEVNSDVPQYKYDFYLEKIRSGQAKYILSQATGGNGQRIPYLYFPGDKPSFLPFVGLDVVRRYAKKVIDNGYKGIFTWITTSDSPDGIFHRNIYECLNYYPYLTCGSETANCDMDYMNRNFGWNYQDESGSVRYSLGYVPSVNDHDLNWRKNNTPDLSVLLRDGRALDRKGILCDSGKYGPSCEYKYCGEWTKSHPNEIYSWPEANEMCPSGTQCDAGSGRCR